MNNYDLSDYIVRLNVANRAHMVSVKVRNTRLAASLSMLLYKNGLIRGFFIQTESILIYIKYNSGGSVIKKIKLISTPGKRIRWHLGYLSLNTNARHFGGFYVISTPKGLLTSHQCLLTAQTCGEILLKIYY